MFTQREMDMQRGKEFALYAAGVLLAGLGGLLLLAAASDYKRHTVAAVSLLDGLNYWMLTTNCQEGAR